MTSMLDRVLGKPKKMLSPDMTFFWVPTSGIAQNISCAISTGYSLTDGSPEEYEIPFIAGEVTVGEGVDVFPLANGGTLIRRLGKPAEPTVKLGFDPAEKYEAKLTFFRDSSDTTPFETVFNLFKEPEVTTPAKPDLARMERKELVDLVELLQNALGSTETNVRTYMKDAKELGALLAEERRKRVPLTTHAHAAEIRSLEAQRDAAQVRRNELQDELHNQRTKYKIKLKECGAVIGTLKGMIKELNRELEKQ